MWAVAFDNAAVTVYRESRFGKYKCDKVYYVVERVRLLFVDGAHRGNDEKEFHVQPLYEYTTL